MSLTKKALLDEMVQFAPEKLPKQVFGRDLWVKPVSEFQRSRRLASLYDKSGQIDRSALRTARVYTVIDHLCDENGDPIFTEQDVPSLVEMDALKLDVLVAAIDDWATEREERLGKPRESNDL